MAVMLALTAAGVEFSATSRGEDKVGITVANKDVVALSDIMENSVGKAVTLGRKKSHEHEEKPDYQTINPEYFKSLPKEERSTRVETKDTARQIVKGLAQADIQYSAVVRKNDTVAVTVAKSDAQKFKQISDKVKGERAVQYVNPDFYRSLPKNERATQRMTEEQAKAKSAELDLKGIEHSAVFNGDKSAVTVKKKDTKVAYFSRNQLKKEVQRINNKGKQSQKKNKDNNLDK
jgi:hypothetical protein